MRVFPYLVGVFVSLIAGLAIAWLSGSGGIGVVASLFVFLISVRVVRERDEARRLSGEEARADARNAAAYSHVGHGGYFGGDGGGGGFGGGGDGGGGSC